MLKEYGVKHNGVEYHNIILERPVEAVVFVDGEKKVLKGNPKITIMKGSFIYGDQLQLTLFLPRESGCGENWNLVEINIPLHLGNEFLKRAHEVMK